MKTNKNFIFFTRLTLLIATAFTMSSCSSYVDQMYQQFDKAKVKKIHPKKVRNQFDFYNTKRLTNPYNINKKRHRRKNRHRARDYDLNDNGNSGSLWVDESNDSSLLFTKDTKRRIGDIIIINVYKKLKNDMAAELKRAFPSRRRLKTKSVSKSKPSSNKLSPSKSTSKEEGTRTAKSYDRITSVIVQAINQKHIVLRGRKKLLYNNIQHSLDLKMLVSRKSISLDDTINSDDILETEINIIR